MFNWTFRGTHPSPLESGLATDLLQLHWNMPKRWFDKLPHNHVALNDAIGQDALLCNMLAERKQSMGK